MGRKRANEPGDDRALPPYSRLQVVNRSLLGLTHAGHTYAVDYDFFDWDDKVSLYADGRRTAVAKAPAAFPVPGGRIEFATTFYGVKRAHLVLATGAELPLSPHPKMAEAWRQRLAQRRPVLSALMARAAVVVLVVGLAVAAIVERALSMRHHWLLDADTWWA